MKFVKILSIIIWVIILATGGVSFYLLITCKGFALFGCSILLYLLNPWLFLSAILSFGGGESRPFHLLSQHGFGALNETVNIVFFLLVNALFWRSLFYVLANFSIDAERRIIEKKILWSLFIPVLLLILTSIILTFSAAQSEKKERSVRIDRNRQIFKSILSGASSELCENIFKGDFETGQVCYFVSALVTKDPSICQKVVYLDDIGLCEEFIRQINNNSLTKTTCENTQYTPYDMRGSCYPYLGVYFQDISLCKDRHYVGGSCATYIFSPAN